MAPGPRLDRELLEEYREQIGSHKQDLMDVSHRILALKDDDTELASREAAVSSMILDTNVRIRRLLRAPAVMESPSGRRDGIELPRIDIPTFKGDIMEWRSFWEQFEVSVHSKPQLSDPEKLAYLRQAVNGGPARYVIEGLSGSGEEYRGAIETLRERYDRPRLLHQAHVRAIAEAPHPKEGDGRELRQLHEVCSQHLRALKTMGYDPSGPFVTSLIEMKLDRSTMFEWHKHTQEKTDVPHYTEILEFIDLRARASESVLREHPKRHSQSVPSKNSAPIRTAYVTNVDTACMSCGAGKHPLYVCRKFKSVSPQQRMTLVRKHHLCFNCLQSGHFAPQCTSDQKCRECNESHHTVALVFRAQWGGHGSWSG